MELDLNYHEKFVQYLIQTDNYDKFEQNLILFSEFTSVDEMVDKKGGTEFIFGGFAFEITQEGEEFWYIFNQNWRAFLAGN